MVVNQSGGNVTRASYKVTSLLHDEVTSLLPQSDKIKTVNCFAFRAGKRLVIPCHKIGTKLTYYSNLSGQDVWWSKEHLKLLAMVHLESTLQSSFDENSYQINNSEYQLENLNISLQVAVLRAVSLTPFQYSNCVCH